MIEGASCLFTELQLLSDGVLHMAAVAGQWAKKHPELAETQIWRTVISLGLTVNMSEPAA
jgi:hypothetical protein